MKKIPMFLSLAMLSLLISTGCNKGAEEGGKTHQEPSGATPSQTGSAGASGAPQMMTQGETEVGETPQIESAVGEGQTAATPTVAIEGGGNADTRMSFFVTSRANPQGGGLFGADEPDGRGGLRGADGFCQQLADFRFADEGGNRKVWRAYLCTAPFTNQAGEAVPANHARSRIGRGPWYNVAGGRIAVDVNALHTSPPARDFLLTERGEVIPANIHDIMTGCMADGMADPSGGGDCVGWSSNGSDSGMIAGHTDWDLPEYVGTRSASWNSSHPVQCDNENISAALGDARIYCFGFDPE